MSLETFHSVGETSQNGVINFREKNFGTGAAADMWQYAPVIPALCDPGAYFYYFDDCVENVYTVVGDGSAAIAETDTHGGIFAITPGSSTDNDEAYIVSGNEFIKFQASKPVFFEVRVAISEGSTNAQNSIVGLMDAAAANSLLDNGGGPAASYDGAVFYKVDGGTTWNFETSNAGTQVTTTDVATRVSNTFDRLGFHFDPNDGTTGKITPYINGVAGTTHDITLAGLEDMEFICGCKNGTTAQETLLLDYVKIIAVR